MIRETTGRGSTLGIMSYPLSTKRTTTVDASYALGMLSASARAEQRAEAECRELLCRSEVLPISIPKPTRRIAAARRWLAAFERIPGTSAGTPDEVGARRMASGGSANGG